MRRDRRMLFVGATVAVAILQVLGAGVAMFARGRAEDRRVTAEAQLADVRRQLEALRATAERPATEPPSRWTLPATADVPGTLQTLQELGDRTGVTLQGVKVAQSNTVGQRSFQLSGRGRPSQVCQFLAGVEQQVPLLIVETGKVLPASADEVAFELGVSTYHQGGAR